MFDIASLRIEGDASDLTKLVDGLDKLTAASGRYHQAGQRTKVVTEQANAAHRGLAADMQRLVSGTNAVASSAEAAAKAQVRQSSATGSLAAQQDRASRTAEAWLRRVENIEKALSPTAAVTNTLVQRTRDLDKAMAVGAIDADRYAAALGQVRAAAANGDEGMTRFSRGIAKGAASAKLTSHELMNLSFQANDLLTQLLTVRNAGDVFRALGQQSGQVAQVFQTAAARGVGFRAAIMGIGTALAPIASALAPVAAGLTVAVAGFGLFERAVDKQTKYATTWGDTWRATVKVVGAAIMNGPVGDAMKWLNAEWSRTLDLITKITFESFTRVAAFISASYKTVVANWQNLPGAFEAIFVASANAGMKAMAWLVNGNIKLLNKLIDGWNSLGPLKAPKVPEIDFSGLMMKPSQNAKKASADLAKFYDADLKTIQAAGRGFLSEIAKQADKEYLARQKAAKGAKDHAAANDDARRASEELDRAILQLIQSLESPAEKALREYNEATLLARRAMDAGKISAEQFRDIIERLNPEVVAAADAQKAWNDEIVRTAAEIPNLPSKLDAWIERMDEAVRKYEAIRRAGDDLFYGIKNQDWAGAFSGLLRVLDQVQIAFSKTATTADKVSAVAGIADSVGNAIGGRGGKAISSAASAGATAFQATGNPYVAAAAAAVAGLSKLLGPRPTNAGAGYDLTTGAISGDKRTSETQAAAVSAGKAIQSIEDALKAAGVGLTDSVRGLVIGTRDQTQIYLASGRELRSAVGDSGAAVDTAMRALLEGATYVSEAQKKLVDSALAAGKGFDAIAEILAQYEAAQKISGNLADEILRLTKPQAYDEQAVRREIEEARKSYQKLASDGYLTADQLATINTQLSTLEGLRLDEVMKRYANSVDAANDNLSTLRSATESAEGMLLDAYNTYAEAKRAEIDGLRQAAASLRAFRKELDFGAIAGRDPVSQLAATRREFERLSALDAANPERLANLQGVSQAFLEASKIASPTELAFNRDLQAVRRATEASEMAATAQADYAQMQLDAQTAAVSQLIALNTTAISIEQAMFAVLAARANEVAGGGAANDNGLDVGRYLALNPDLAANWNAGGSLRGAGQTLEEAARAHYATTGKWEVSQGLRKFATGGEFTVGGSGGTDSQLVQFMASPDETVSIRTPSQMGGDTGRLEALIERQNEIIEAQAAELRSIRKGVDQTQNELKTIRGVGMWVRGEAPDEPVQTQAA